MICQAHGAVFIEKIGGVLKSGQKHDDRSPDYDDWELNGDIILWNDVLEKAFEVSSMGIRVDAEAMDRQLTLAGADDRRTQSFLSLIPILPAVDDRFGTGVITSRIGLQR